MLSSRFQNTEPFLNRDFSHQVVHLNYRLANSIPRAYILRLKEEYEMALQAVARNDQRMLRQWIPNVEPPISEDQVKDHFALRYDELLHRITDGPMFLADQKVKEIVRDSWLYFEKLGQIELIALCVMSNHVHVMLRHPSPDGVTSFKQLLDHHKRFTGTQINRLQQVIGREVWAPKGFDRDVRPGRFWEVFWYVINNPKQAGMTSTPLSWRGTWAKPGLVEGTNGFW